MENNNNYIHPSDPGTIGSRNSILRKDRDEYAESQLLIDEQVDRILNHIEAKLPQEVLSELQVKSNVKSLLHNYYNQGLQNMLGRYLTTTEDELLKKYNRLISTEESKNALTYMPTFISDILNQLGKEDTFHTGKIEKSFTHVYQNLQAYINRSLQNFADATSSSLIQKDGAGAFIADNNAYKMIKCSFKSNRKKPATVLDIKLAFNILNTDLLLPLYHYQETLSEFLKKILAEDICLNIESCIDQLSQSLKEDGMDGLSSSRYVFEHIKQLDEYLGDDTDIQSEDSPRYSRLAKKFIDYLEDVPNEGIIDHNSPVANIRNLIEDSRLQYIGFDHIVNNILSLLDEAQLGCQFVNNLKNARECVLREYTKLAPEDQPDENFGMRLIYYNNKQLKELRTTWDKQAKQLEEQIESTLRVILEVYNQHRDTKRTLSYFDIAREITGTQEGEEDTYKDILWHELQVFSTNNSAEKSYTFFDRIKSYIKFMDSKVEECYKDQFPKERMIIEKRINYLEEQFLHFSSLTNPYHLQEGLLIEVDVTTIKEQKYTLHSISSVLHKFLQSISKQFIDANITDRIEERKKEANYKTTATL